jgi:hypothetical protein
MQVVAEEFKVHGHRHRGYMRGTYFFIRTVTNSYGDMLNGNSEFLAKILTDASTFEDEQKRRLGPRLNFDFGGDLFYSSQRSRPPLQMRSLYFVLRSWLDFLHPRIFFAGLRDRK